MSQMGKVRKTCALQSHLGRAHRSHTTMQQSRHPKRHPDPISRFATIHFQDTDRHTDTQTYKPTDRWDKRQLDCIALTLAILITSDVLKRKEKEANSKAKQTQISHNTYTYTYIEQKSTEKSNK